MAGRGARRATILVADDVAANVALLGHALEAIYEVRIAHDGGSALQEARREPLPDLILLDVMMPGIGGLDACRALHEDPLTRHIPVVFVTALGEVADEEHGFEAGAVDYLTKPVHPALLRARVRTHLDIADQRRALESLVRERTAELAETQLEIVRRLGRAAEYRDNHTGMHVIRMSRMTELLGRAWGLDERETSLLLNASPMHDIGKIGVPDRVLLKPGILGAADWQLLRSHTTMGAAIIGEHRSALLREARIIALSHHEKWDGTGYPGGLAGEAVPLSGRLAALADVFDALTSERPYKRAWRVDEAVALIRAESGKHFEPRLIRVFDEVLPELLRCREQYPDDIVAGG
jgi:putative two-component system response regulator